MSFFLAFIAHANEGEKIWFKDKSDLFLNGGVTSNLRDIDMNSYLKSADT